jgi:hypothetical protein
MTPIVIDRLNRLAVSLPKDQESEVFQAKENLTRLDIIQSYRVAEFVTQAQDGSPVCWPLAPDFEDERLIFSTGYVYPTKARNAQRNPRVSALFSDPTSSGHSDAEPLVLVQGLAEVFDQDLQRNTERYVDQLLQKGPILFRSTLRTPMLRQLLVGYLARIWIEVLPQHEYVWDQTKMPPEPLRAAVRPKSFSPGPGIKLPPAVFGWLSRYARPPVLAYVDQAGWPAVIRTPVDLQPSHITIGAGLQPQDGAPACLTYHRLIGNYQANDTFLIRGHFDGAGRLVPEKVVGFGGTDDDRGLGSLKLMRVLLGYRKILSRQLEKEGRQVPVVRPSHQK